MKAFVKLQYTGKKPRNLATYGRLTEGTVFCMSVQDYNFIKDDKGKDATIRHLKKLGETDMKEGRVVPPSKEAKAAAAKHADTKSTTDKLEVEAAAAEVKAKKEAEAKREEAKRLGDGQDVKPYSDWPVRELKEELEHREVKFVPSLTKPKLVALLEADDEADEDEDED